MQARDIQVTNAERFGEADLYSNSWALVVGIDRYDSASIPPLRFAAADASALAKLLPALGFPNVTVLLNDEATPGAIRRILGQFNANMQANDRLLVHFSCHGVASQTSGGRRGHLLLHGSKIVGEWPTDQSLYLDRPPEDHLDMSGFLQEVHALPAKHKVIILDACFSGFMAQARAVTALTKVPELRGCVSKPVTAVFAAGMSEDRAWEDDKHGHGEFTRQLLEGMSGSADHDRRGWFTLSQLAEFVTQRVRSSSNGRQNPLWTRYDGEGDFVFVWNRDFELELRKRERWKRAEFEKLRAEAGEAKRTGDLQTAYERLLEAKGFELDAELICGEIKDVEERIGRAEIAALQEAARVSAGQKLSEMKAHAGQTTRERASELAKLLREAGAGQRSQDYGQEIAALTKARRLVAGDPKLTGEIDEQIELARSEKKKLELADREQQARRLVADGRGLFESGHFDEAIQKLEEALQLSREHREIEELLQLVRESRDEVQTVRAGEELLLKGRLSEARILWEELLLRVPGFPGLGERLKSVKLQESALPLLFKRNSRDGLLYVLVKQGIFRMGAAPGDGDARPEEKPVRRVKISRPFWITQTPVAVGAYRRYRPNVAHVVHEPWQASLPMTGVTWEEALQFCRNSGGRLPSEAEWEFAARGGVEGLRFPWGTYPRACPTDVAAVGHAEPNGFGLMDVCTNVWEWCADAFDEGYYRSRPDPDVDPLGPEKGKRRVVRGGSYCSNPLARRLSARAGKVSRVIENLKDIGFRCVIDEGDFRGD
jgi:formylglycine-generating enzyme required for sulfatase activity